jgi:hypothetical protein
MEEHEQAGVGARAVCQRTAHRHVALVKVDQSFMQLDLLHHGPRRL